MVMEKPSSRSGACAWQWTSCSLSHPTHHHFHHHHHYPLILFPHHHHLFLCPHHNNRHHHRHFICHGHINASFAPVPARNPQLVGAAPLPNTFKLETEATHFEDAVDHGPRMLEEQEHVGLEEVEEDDDDDEPIFVLTDEWREFFAKSEAKRKLAKKQAKKK